MDSSIIHGLFVEERGRTLCTKSLILTDRNHMTRAYFLNRAVQLPRPAVMHIHGEQAVIQPSGSFLRLVHILHIEINLRNFRNPGGCKIRELLRGHVPAFLQYFDAAMPLIQPCNKSLMLKPVMTRARSIRENPYRIEHRGFINQIPVHIRRILVARHNGANEPFLSFHTLRVKVRINPLPRLRGEREEGERHLKIMLLGGHDKCIYGSKHILRDMPVNLHDIAVSRPDSCTNPVDSGLAHLGHIPVPYVAIRQEQEFPGHIARHIGHTHDRQRSAIFDEIIPAACDRFASCQ
ncbi:hypothetical protein D3C81_1115010 [compost metagenome]